MLPASKPLLSLYHRIFKVKLETKLENSRTMQFITCRRITVFHSIYNYLDLV